MSLLLLEMPAADEKLIAWLERQLVDVHLNQLIEELSFVRSSFCPGASQACFDAKNEWQPPQHRECEELLENCLNCDTRQILRNGLRVLNPAQLSALFSQPHLLWPLQELVLIHGGDYWQRVCDSVAIDRSVSRRPNQLALSSWALLALAASIISVALLVHSASPPTIPAVASQWGPGQLAAETKTNLPEADYLSLLADSVQQWYDKRPADGPALIRRAEQFVAGCQTLIDLPHPNLSADRRLSLRRQCEQCRRELLVQIQLLQQQNLSVAVALVAMDEAIDRLHANLRT